MNLETFFSEHPKAALAFSGGVDSVYLLYAARKYGCDIHAYYVKSAFQPDFELEDAVRIAKELHTDMTVLPIDVLSDSVIVQNPIDRCYHCKRKIFSAIIHAAAKDGYSLILDGTNASDDISDRPGMRAIKELSVRSPLRECNLTKDTIRILSKEAGLFTWDKSAYACLATRIPSGTSITKERLGLAEQSEQFLRSLDFSDVRVRQAESVDTIKDTQVRLIPTDLNISSTRLPHKNGIQARIQVPKEQIPRLLSMEKRILEAFAPYYDSIIIDLEGRT